MEFYRGAFIFISACFKIWIVSKIPTDPQSSSQNGCKGIVSPIVVQFGQFQKKVSFLGKTSIFAKHFGIFGDEVLCFSATPNLENQVFAPLEPIPPPNYSVYYDFIRA